MIQDVIPYVLSDFISYLVPSILSPTIYVVLVYFISKLRTDELAANLFISIASVRLVRTVQVKSWYADTKWNRPFLYNLPLRVWRCSLWVVNKWLVASHSLTNYFRPHYSGPFRRHPCWETHWIYFKCTAFICIWVIRRWQLRYQYELRVHIVGRVPTFHRWRFAQLDFSRTNVPVYVAWIRWISPYFYSFRERLLSSPNRLYLKPSPRNHCDDAV